MADVPDSNSPAASLLPPVPAPTCALLVMCVECGQGLDVPLPIDQDVLAIALAQKGWFASVMAPSDEQPGSLPLLAALCATCAPTIFPPEVMKAAEQRRQALLRSLQLRAQQGAR